MQLIINAPEDLTQNLKLLKPQGFLFLSLIQKEFKEEINKNNNLINLNIKQFAEKFELAVSTVRRWIKKLVALDFVKLVLKASPLSPPVVGESKLEEPKLEDPLEHFLETMSVTEKTVLRMMMRTKGVEIRPGHTDEVKKIMFSKPEYLQGLAELYQARVERDKNLEIIRQVREKAKANTQGPFAY